MFENKRYHLVFNKAEFKPKDNKFDYVLKRPIVCGDADLSLCNLMFLTPYNNLMNRCRYTTPSSVGLSNFKNDHSHLANYLRAEEADRTFLSYDV